MFGLNLASFAVVIDFDEADQGMIDGHLNELLCRKFINLLERCLEICKKDKQPLENFKLCMLYSNSGEILIVKELDISLNPDRPLMVTAFGLL